MQPGRLRAPGLGVEHPLSPARPGRPRASSAATSSASSSRRTCKAIRIQRGPAEWQSAELAAPATAQVLLGYGFSPVGEPQLVHTATTSFEAEPAKKLA